MEIRNGIKFSIGTSRYIIKNTSGDRGEVWGLSNTDNDYSINCVNKYSEGSFKTIKIEEYPYKVGDYVIVLQSDGSNGEGSYNKGNCYQISRIEGDAIYTTNGNGWTVSKFRPAFSWEYPKEKVIVDVNNLQIRDLIDGEIYYWKLNSDEYIDKFLSKGDGLYRASHYISIRGREFKSNPDDVVTPKNLRLATEEEKHWLNTCIEDDEFVSKETMLKLNKKEDVNDLDKMLAEKENYLNVMTSGPLKSVSESKLSPASEMKTTISGLRPRSKKVCYTSTQVKIAM